MIVGLCRFKWNFEIISSVENVFCVPLQEEMTRLQENLTMARMHKEFIQDLLAKGYSAEDVERLVYGGKGWNKVRRAYGYE